MDQCVVDLTHLPHARAGDVVTVFGRADGEAIELDEFAGWSDTIVHEALCRVGARVPRLYSGNGAPGPDQLHSLTKQLAVPIP